MRPLGEILGGLGSALSASRILRGPKPRAGFGDGLYEFLAGLDARPYTFRQGAAERLADALGDAHSLGCYIDRCRRYHGAQLAEAYRQATAPGIHKPGAKFVSVLKTMTPIRQQK